MVLLPFALEQRLISRILNEGVFEEVSPFTTRIMLPNEGGDQKTQENQDFTAREVLAGCISARRKPLISHPLYSGEPVFSGFQGLSTP